MDKEEFEAEIQKLKDYRKKILYKLKNKKLTLEDRFRILSNEFKKITLSQLDWTEWVYRCFRVDWNQSEIIRRMGNKIIKEVEEIKQLIEKINIEELYNAKKKLSNIENMINGCE